jgi:DNA-nicking Smr family endonuclease
MCSCPKALWRGSMRRLNPDEKKLWAKVVESVRPLDGVPPPVAPVEPEPESASVAVAARKGRPAPPPPPPSSRKPPGETLDGSWDRRLGRGLVAPDAMLDLHGHNLATAYDLLDRQLEQAIDSGARLLLLVTGKPPGAERPAKRGAIRAAVGDWLHASRHSSMIAAVRNAHPRHGGTGALYIVLRRPRD